MKYNFDEIVGRRGTDCLKYDGMAQFYGSNDNLPMWVADMDFRTPDFIIEALKKRLEHPVLGYFNHTERFRQAIADWVLRRHKWKIDTDWILFSPGVVPALAAIVQAFTEPHDKIIVQPPVYHPFFYVIENQNRTIIENPLKLDGDTYLFDFEDLEKKLHQGTKLLILSNPHNPVGRCWQPEELRQLSELCLKHNCIVVSDEIHSDLMIDGNKHTVTASLSDAISNNTITCMAPSKTFNMAGLSTSEIIVQNEGHRNRINHVLTDGLHIQCGNIFGDIGLIAAYKDGEEWLTQLLDYLTENVKYSIRYIRERIPVLKTFRHEATYLLWVDFSGTGLTHSEIAGKLVREAHLALNDGSIFGRGGEKHFRINLACPKSTVTEALIRLKKTFSKYNP